MSTIYIPYNLQKEPSLAARAVLHATLKHMGDFQSMLCQIIAEKYGISEEEIFRTVEEHPRYKELLVNPMIHDIMSGAKEEADPPPEQKVVEAAPEKKNIFVKCPDGKVKKVKKTVGSAAAPAAPAAPAAQKLIAAYLTNK